MQSSMSARIRLSAFPVVVLACATLLWGANGASGWFSPHCDGASFYLSDVDGLSSGEKLNLNLRQQFPWNAQRPQETWEHVFAERCSPKRKCESAARARIWLDKRNPNDKRASGKYDVEFGALHLAGQFHLKYRKDKKWICE
jgi:hypothetical protein